MKRTAVIVIVALALAAPAQALISSEPDQTLLWNDFSGVTVIDTFLVATADAGVVVCRYDSSSAMFEPINHLFLSARPMTRRLFGDILVIRSTVDILYFLDLSDLPEITLLGRADLEVEFYDYALDGDDLYICAGFKGLFRYRLRDYNSAEFVDSSMIGAHYVRVQIDGNRMYALDDYNGVLTYNIAGDGFGVFEHFLYLPRQAKELIGAGPELAILLATSSDILMAQWSDSALVVSDTVRPKYNPSTAFFLDSLVLSIGWRNSYFDRINRNTGARYSYSLAAGLSDELQGDTMTLSGDRHVVLPSADGGLRVLNIEIQPGTINAAPAYARPGPVQALFLHDGRLYTGGAGNPLDVYSLGSDLTPTAEFTVFPGLTDVRAASHQGDSVFILYPEAEAIFLMAITPDDLVLDTLLPAHPELTWNVKYNRQQVGEFRSVFGIGSSHLDVYVFSDTVDITKLDILTALAPILDVEIFDSLLVFSTAKFELWVYRIYDDFSLEFRSTLHIGTRITDLVPLPPDTAGGLPSRLVGFDYNQMWLFDLADPAHPSIDDVILLPVGAAASVVEDELLYTISAAGIGIFDITDTVPVLLDYGGLGGSLIAAEDGIVAVSDGEGVHLFDLREYSTAGTAVAVRSADVFQLRNYPNPFNSSTAVAYNLAKAGHVRLTVYNLLGQHVATIVDEFQTAGPHRVVWTALKSDGRGVATGIYFYRLTVGDQTESRKMLLVR
ncbi:MAG TPA: T9SS type A sorting domain-containing protein [Acidobacteriota bacterium]|nr:T9SS type A sorting domain-containing protein [Acidobacteriota bacterium]